MASKETDQSSQIAGNSSIVMFIARTKANGTEHDITRAEKILIVEDTIAENIVANAWNPTK